MKEAYEYLLQETGLNKGDFVVAAISGGADSMALLHLLIRIKKVININVICAHVNHSLRKESDDEKLFIEEYCHENDVIFEYMKIESYGTDNFHNEAHEKRYAFFNKIVEKYHAKYLLTAHHGDDLIETILMRIVRGSTLRGYSGFSKELSMNGYKILRPLIFTTKDEIYEYMKNNDLKYATDLSNFKEKYTRNRYRKYILPFLKKEDKNVHKKFYKFSKTLLEYSDYIDLEVKEVYEKVFKDNILDIILFNKEHTLIQKRLICYMLERFYKDDLTLITDKHSEAIYKLITSKRNATINMPNNIVAIKEYDKLIIKAKENSSPSYKMELKEKNNVAFNKKIEVINETLYDTNYICRLDTSVIKMPLYIRSRIDGDKIEVKGLNGSKKINDIFINSKISKEEREIWPIVVDSNDTIVWLPGLKKSKFDRTKDEKYDIILKYY